MTPLARARLSAAIAACTVGLIGFLVVRGIEDGEIKRDQKARQRELREELLSVGNELCARTRDYVALLHYAGLLLTTDSAFAAELSSPSPRELVPRGQPDDSLAPAPGRRAAHEAFAEHVRLECERLRLDAILALHFSRDGIVTHQFEPHDNWLAGSGVSLPFPGESAIGEPLGHDLLTDPDRRRCVQLSLRTPHNMADGPFHFRDDKRGWILRLPLQSDRDVASLAPPIGLLSLAMDLDALLASAARPDLDIAMRLASGANEAVESPAPVAAPARRIAPVRAITFGNPVIFTGTHQAVQIDVGLQRYELAAAYSPSAFGPSVWTLRISGALTVILLAALIAFSILRPARMQLAIDRATEELATSQHRSRMLMDSSPVAIFTTDANGQCTFANASWQRFTGLSMAESRGSEWVSGIHPEDRGKVYGWWRDFVEDGIPFEHNYRLHHKDGHVIFVAGLAVALRDAEGMIEGYTGALTDISSLIEIEEQKRELEARILHSQKLESLGVLAGGIAHDFNNILMGILGHAELAQREIAPTSPAGDDLAGITHAAQRAAELCRQMLAYAGRGQFRLEVADLNELASEIPELLGVSISKNSTLAYELAPHPLRVHADSTQLRQILMNLVMNASEAIGEGEGNITLRTGRRTFDPEGSEQPVPGIELQAREYAFFEVEDDGCGMSPETIARIFEPFFTTKFTGRGLGMSAVLGIVRAHGGGLFVRSSPGQGSTFTVLLPPIPNRWKREPGRQAAPAEGHQVERDYELRPEAPPVREGAPRPASKVEER